MKKHKMRLAVNALSIFLLTTLSLTLTGCGDKAAGNMTEAAAAKAKDLTPKERLSETKREAEAGDAEAQFILGLMYADGEGVPQDSAKAVEWWQKAAAQGHAAPQYNLGLSYAHGEGVPQDSAKAVKWWQKAAAQGHAAAQNNLGVRYFNGDGVPQDSAKAVEWWQKAAAQGDALAQFSLGGSYWLGNGVSKNHVLAYAWLNLSAAQGEDSAKELRDLLEEELTPAQRAEGQSLATNWKKGEFL